MGYKYTTLTVRKDLEKEKFKLLGEYKSFHAKLNYKCPKGHIRSSSYANWKSGARCLECDRPVHTTESVREMLLEKGHILKSDYVNNSSILVFDCLKCGAAKETLKASTFFRGGGCKNCKKIEGKPRIKFDYEKLKKEFKTKGLVLISTKESLKASKKMLFKCIKHNHSGSILYNDLEDSKGCSTCYRQRSGGLESARKIFLSKGLILKAKSYKSKKTKMPFVCVSKGHTREMSLAQLERKNAGCAECNNRYVYMSDVENAFENANLRLLNFDEFKTSTSWLSNFCLVCGTKGKSQYAHIRTGSGCANCSNHGFDFNKPAILYYLKITRCDKLVFYKIGITNRTVEQRYRLNENETKIETILEIQFDKGSDAKAHEKNVLDSFSEYRYKGKKFLVNGGDTELFVKDVLSLEFLISKNR